MWTHNAGPTLASGKTGYPHEGTETLAINDTWFGRLYTRLALGTLGRIHKPDGLCHPISKTRIVKTGRRVHLTEAATMKFIAENTSIPIPKVYCSDRAFILMERIHGEEIPTAWKRLQEPGRRKIYGQLRAILQELRSLKPPPGTGIESCTGGSLYDSRIKQCRGTRFGPFKTIQDFHFWLREGLQPSEIQGGEIEDGVERQDLEKMAAMQDAGPWPPPVFTHADLNPFNILVRDDEVVAVLDWEFAGWYPSYWEYTSAWHGNLTRTGWQEALDQFLDPYAEELEMERTRQKWWGEV
ncbi:hypothetical protein LTR29_009862 [Friedmanniomyces endolithicus]|nr:hypothetical protein LTR29_009862 [Friedmanniomyces endolithicus]